MNALANEMKSLRENDGIFKARIDSLIVINEKLTKSLKKKIAIDKKKKTKTNELDKANELDETSNSL